MSEQLDHLWTLHGLDEEISRLSGHLERFPQLRRDLETRVADARRALERHKAAVAEVQLQRRNFEREVEAVDAQERKYLGQQAAVKTNAEYQALTHEINGCRQKRSDLETEVLLRLEEEERLAAERPTIDQTLKAAEAELAERVRAIDAEEGAERAKIDELHQQRDGKVAALDASIRHRYERIHASRAGQAVVPILKGACGGCFRAQPPQMLQEAKRRDRLLSCDGCGRILVLPPDAGA